MKAAALAGGLEISPSLTLVRPLGAGGMGSVWAARHKGMQTEVAVKFLADHLAAAPDAVERCWREAVAASQVKSPHVVQMLDHGIAADGQPFIVMELLEGCDLAKVLQASGPLPPRQVATMTIQLARALEKAHARGIVHRDLKPSNIFLCDVGDGLFVKLLDFGVARYRPSSSTLPTTHGVAVGTPVYMSPEQLAGDKAIDGRSDVWALGVVAFEALTGVRPFEGATVFALALAIERGPSRPASSCRASVPAAFDAWFARACARAASERFASALEAARALSVALGASHEVEIDTDQTIDFSRFRATNAIEPAVARSDASAPARQAETRTMVLSAGAQAEAARAPRVRRRAAQLAIAATLSSAILALVFAKLSPSSAPSPPAMLPAAATPAVVVTAVPVESAPAVASVTPIQPTASVPSGSGANETRSRPGNTPAAPRHAAQKAAPPSDVATEVDVFKMPDERL